MIKDIYHEKNEKFEISVSWKAVTILSNCEKEFDK